MNILEAIRSRRSVRNYDGRDLSPAMRAALNDAIINSSDPFGGKVTVRLKDFSMADGFRPGTYGMINGARAFFLLYYADDDAAALSAGFRFEQTVLRAQSLGLGTCWIAGTFRGTDFDRDAALPDGSRLRAVCPVGHAVSESLKGRIARMALGSDRRKPFDKMFFCGDFGHAVPDDNRFHEALGMMRLAPSSRNSQPWRALVRGNTVHFYCIRKGKFSVLDCGIGLCHFYLTERFYGHDGRFTTEVRVPAAPEGLEYLISYKA